MGRPRESVAPAGRDGLAAQQDQAIAVANELGPGISAAGGEPDVTGIWAQLSPDRGWVQVRAVDPSGDVYRLDSCDGSSQEQLPPVKSAGDFFSGDSRWHAASDISAEGGGQVSVRDLSGESDLSLPAIVASPVYWLKEPRAGLPETYLVSGRVLTAEGGPLAGSIILLEGTPKATTGEDGAFVISGLAPGKYTLEPQYDDSKFEPERRKVSLPPDVLDADFVSSLSVAAAGQPTAVVQADLPPQPPPAPVSDYVAMAQAVLAGYGVQYENWMPYAAAIICLAILGLLVIGGLAWYLLRSRRLRAAKAAPPVLAPAPVAVISPVQVKSAPASVSEPAVSDTQPDPAGLCETVTAERISMCGFQPTSAALVAALGLGATGAELVRYETSGQASGDYGRVVGYAGIKIF